MSFKLTAEQLHCIELKKTVAANPKPTGNIIKLEAGAGASKTTTLELMSREDVRPSLYLAFNKAIAEEAKGRFPAHVECRTTHSVAYSRFGRMLQDKLKRPVGAYVNVCGTGVEIARYFKISHIETMERNILPAGAIGLAIKETVGRFECSGDFELSMKHVSIAPAEKMEKDKSFPVTKFKELVLEKAKKLWELRIDPKTQILANHETYLKLFQLSKPILEGYDVIYCDEMQDSSDCVIDIISRQNAEIVLVGDDAQSIYGFRGAVNAMKKFGGEVGRLSMSFRFGPAIAEAATCVLDLKPNNTMTLSGWDQVDSVIMDYIPEDKVDAPRCQLYRTNATLVGDAVRLIAKGKKVSIEMDVKDFVNQLNSVVALAKGDMKGVKHEEIIPYTSWKEICEEAQTSKGAIARLVEIVSSGEHTHVLSMLENYRKPENPDIILTTAHKSKGREFDIVVLADDFPSVYDRKGEWVGLIDQEVHLLYVALTRAKLILVRNQTLRDIMNRKGVSIDVKEIAMYDPSIKSESMQYAAKRFGHFMGGALADSEHFDDILTMAIEEGLDIESELRQEMRELDYLNMPGEYY